MLREINDKYAKFIISLESTALNFKRGRRWAVHYNSIYGPRLMRGLNRYQAVMLSKIMNHQKEGGTV